MECFGTIDFDNNSRLITLSAIIISGLHCIFNYFFDRILYILYFCNLTEVFPCFFLSCKANARAKPANTGHGPHSFPFLCCSMYFLCSMYFCVVLCIVCFVSFSVLFVCTYVCTELLPPGGYPLAVKHILFNYISKSLWNQFVFYSQCQKII
jgi:hypothetical protein